MRNVLCCPLFLRIFTAQPVTVRIHPRKRAALLAIAMSLFLLAPNARIYSQNSGVATYSRNELINIARHMREKPDIAGNAKNGLLEQHLDPVTILAVRTKSGRAELHAASADSFFVVQGEATLITGGTIINPRGAGEVRGDSVRGGVHAELRAGDVVHIPPGTPHQLLLNGTDPFVYVLIKIPMQ
jgi:mannose-6-phosphate isomerase-like protein (cupin superfamily)